MADVVGKKIDLTGEILKGSFFLMLSKSLVVPVALASLALLGRILGPVGMGQWALIIAAGSFASIVFINWTQPYYIRFGCEEYLQYGTINRTWNVRWPLVLAGIVLCGLIVFTDPYGFWNRFFGIMDSQRIWVFAYFLYMFFLLEGSALYQIINQLWGLARRQFTVALATLILYGVLFLYSQKIQQPLAMQTVLMGFIAVNLSVWGLSVINRLSNLKVQCNLKRRSSLQSIFGYSWPVLVGFMVGYFSDWGDQVLIRMFYDNQQVGLYQAAYSFFISIIGLCSPLAVAVTPALVIAYKEGDEQLKRYIQRIVPAFGILWFAFIIILSPVLPDVFLLILGRSFTDASGVIVILAVSLPGAVLSNLCSPLYFLQGRTLRYTVIMAVMTLINVALSLLLLPRFGIIGGAIATTASYLASQCFYLFDQSRYIKAVSLKIWLLFGIPVLLIVIQNVNPVSLVTKCIYSLVALALLLLIGFKLDIISQYQWEILKKMVLKKRQE